MIDKLFLRKSVFQSLRMLIVSLMLMLVISYVSVYPVAAAETAADAEKETEKESETAPDPRTLWYMEHIPQVDATTSANTAKVSTAKAPDKLKNLVETDYTKQVKSRRRIRRKLTAYMKEHQGILLSEMYAVHYIYTDETDYLVVWIGETPYIYAFEMNERGRVTILETEPDEATRSSLLEMAMADPTVSDVHYWNAINTTKKEEKALLKLPASKTGERAVPYFNQGLGFWNGTKKWTCTDWPKTTFDINGHTMKEAGCGFFAAAMAISYIRQEIIPPIDFKENGQYTGDGAAVTVGLESAGMYGVKAVITSNWDEAYAALQSGHLVMENVGPGLFARYGHFILLTGIRDDGRIIVNDPGNEYHTYWHSWETYDAAVFPDNIHDTNTPFTIFG